MERRSFLARLAGTLGVAAVAPERLLAAPVPAQPTVAPTVALPAVQTQLAGASDTAVTYRVTARSGVVSEIVATPGVKVLRVDRSAPDEWTVGVQRPSFGAGPQRITVTARNAAGAADCDVVDIPPRVRYDYSGRRKLATPIGRLP